MAYKLHNSQLPCQSRQRDPRARDQGEARVFLYHSDRGSNCGDECAEAEAEGGCLGAGIGNTSLYILDEEILNRSY